MRLITVMTVLTHNDNRFSLVMLQLSLRHVFEPTDQLPYLMQSCCFRESASLSERIMGNVITEST